MKILQCLLILLLFANCSTLQEQEKESTIESNELEVINIPNETLEVFLGEIDSTNIVDAIGCNHGYFGHISSEFVLEIPASIYQRDFESRRVFDLSENGLQCNLLVFEKDSSHLANICTDVIIINYPKPKRRILSITGKMKVFIGHPKELWGEQINNAYIKIEEIQFIDSLDNNRKITIKDKILWEVSNWGTPG